MTGRRTEDQITALERARAQIEIALSADTNWLAWRTGTAGSSHLHERALAGNPLYRSWVLLNDAIRDLHAMGARQHEVQPSIAPDDLTRIRGIGPALAKRLTDRGITGYSQIAAWRRDDVRDVSQALGLGRQISRQNWIEQAAVLELRRPAVSPAGTEAAPPARTAHVSVARAEPQGVALHDILEHIRKGAALRRERPSISRDLGAKDASGAAARPGLEQQLPELVDGIPGPEGVGDPEPEEATVTFVVREDADTAPAENPSARVDVERSPHSDRWASVEADDPLYFPDDSQAEEAEVAIVSKSSDGRPVHRSRKA